MSGMRRAFRFTEYGIKYEIFTVFSLPYCKNAFFVIQ